MKVVDLLDHNLARLVSEVGRGGLRWRQHRSFLLADSLSIVDAQGVAHSPSSLTPQAIASMRGAKGVIRLTGCLRGVPLFIHSLVHLPGIGAVRVKRIISHTQPQEEVEADRQQQDDLVFEAVPDNLLGEQTWPEDSEMPGFDDDKDGEGDDDEGNDEDDEDNGEDGSEGDEEDDEDYYKGQEQIPSQTKKVYASTLPADYDPHRRDKDNTVRQKDNDEGVMNSDEYVDVPEDRSARERFARYRALQSFRNSYWHPKENLPYQYAKVFQFDDIKGMQKSVGQSVEDVVKCQLEPFVMAKKNKRKGGDNGSVSGSITGGRSRSASVESMSMEDEDEENMEEGEEMMIEGNGGSAGHNEIDLNSFLVPNAPDYVRSGKCIYDDNICLVM